MCFFLLFVFLSADSLTHFPMNFLYPDERNRKWVLKFLFLLFKVYLWSLLLTYQFNILFSCYVDRFASVSTHIRPLSLWLASVISDYLSVHAPLSLVGLCDLPYRLERTEATGSFFRLPKLSLYPNSKNTTSAINLSSWCILYFD